MSDKKTAIITGASGGIGGGLVEAFLKLGYHVVGTSRNASQSLAASARIKRSSDAKREKRIKVWSIETWRHLQFKLNSGILMSLSCPRPRH